MALTCFSELTLLPLACPPLSAHHISHLCQPQYPPPEAFLFHPLARHNLLHLYLVLRFTCLGLIAASRLQASAGLGHVTFIPAFPGPCQGLSYPQSLKELCPKNLQ